jgi:hypothetical protein
MSSGSWLVVHSSWLTLLLRQPWAWCAGSTKRTLKDLYKVRLVVRIPQLRHAAAHHGEVRLLAGAWAQPCFSDTRHTVNEGVVGVSVTRIYLCRIV